MKFFSFALFAIVCSPLAAAKEDPFDVAMNKCLNELGLLEAIEINNKQQDCISGCMLRELKMIDGNGKLLPNGIEDFVDSIPSDFRGANLLADLNELKPALLEAKDACEVGTITDHLVGGFFETELEF